MASHEKMKTRYKDFYKKMHKVSPNVTEQTLYVYLRNVTRLYKLTHETDTVPATGAWLSEKKLYDTFDKLDLSKRRLLSVAAVKAAKAYGVKDEEWQKRLAKASDAYDKHRVKRKITEKEKSKWPDSLDALHKAAKQQKIISRRSLNRKTKTLKDLLEIQKWVILVLYANHPIRLDFADVHLGKPEAGKQLNYLHRDKRKPWTLTLRKYKTAKYRGETVILMKRQASMALSMFVPLVKELTEHGKLLTNTRGQALSRNALSKLLTKLTKYHLGKKGFSAGLNRVLFSTKNKEVLEKASEITQGMQHNLKQSLRYSRK